MSTTERPRTTAFRSPLEAVRGLAPAIAARADEIDRGRRLPQDLLAELHAAGCFRMLLPSTLGGSDIDLPSALHVFEALARAGTRRRGGSWRSAPAPGATWWRCHGRRSRASTRRATASSSAASTNPTGSVAAVAGGFRASGRWAFASGCGALHLDLRQLHRGGRRRAPHPHRGVRSRRGGDRGHVAGRGTVRHGEPPRPGARRARPAGAHLPAVRGRGDDRHPASRRSQLPAVIALEIASVALGVAAGALDDITTLAVDKVPLLGRSSLAADALFQSQLAVADTELHAGRGRPCTRRPSWRGPPPSTERELSRRAAGTHPRHRDMGDGTGRSGRRLGVPVRWARTSVRCASTRCSDGCSATSGRSPSTSSCGPTPWSPPARGPRGPGRRPHHLLTPGVRSAGAPTRAAGRRTAVRSSSRPSLTVGWSRTVRCASAMTSSARRHERARGARAGRRRAAAGRRPDEHASR